MHNPLTLMLASLGGGGSGNGGEGRADPSFPFHSRMIRAKFYLNWPSGFGEEGERGGGSEDTHHRQNQTMNNEEIDKCTQ